MGTRAEERVVSKSVLAAVVVAGAVVLPAGVAQAQGGPQGGPPATPPGMHQMHKLMQEGNPGMAQMHKLMQEGNPGMAGCTSSCTPVTERRLVPPVELRADRPRLAGRSEGRSRWDTATA
jgi:hypothetical protein